MMSLAPGQSPKPEEIELPALREDLQLLSGEDAQGRICHRIHDPCAGRYFMIDETTVSILSVWQLKVSAKVAEAASSVSGATVTVSDVLAVLQFLKNNFLLQETGAGKDRFLKIVGKTERTLKNLLPQYLYFKMPLLHPEKFLDVIYPFAKPFFHPLFWIATLIASVISLYLLSRQWDYFIGSIPDFFRFDGMLVYGVAMLASKALHEMAHALTVRHYGLRVPTMGIVFLVLFPLLYTDATESWRSANARIRMNIAAAGIVAELALAAFASFAWLIADEGPWKSAFFVLATVNWVTTVIFNMNPLMRFDGYFILSDWLKVENLQQRAFAELKHQCSRLFLGIELPVEPHDRRWKVFFCVFGILAFVYRISVVISISLLVYNYFFKFLGVVLFAHQVFKSVGQPLRKCYLWLKVNWTKVKLTKLFYITALCTGLILFSLCLPLSERVSAQAELVSVEKTVLHAAESGRLVVIPSSAKTIVNKGELLFQIDSPEISREIEMATLQITRLRSQLSTFGFDYEQTQERVVTLEELNRAQTRLKNALERQEKLSVLSPYDGRIDWVETPFTQNEWLGRGMPLAVINNPKEKKIVSFISELDRKRVSVGARASFYPASTSVAPQKALVTSLSDYPVKQLSAPAFSSIYGGEIAVQSQDVQQPMNSVYRVELMLCENSDVLPYETKGRVEIEAEREIPLLWLWRKLSALWIRESVF